MMELNRSSISEEPEEDETDQYHDDHFYEDEMEYDEVIETEAFIQYNAAIGPNILVSKDNATRKPTPRFTTTSKRTSATQRTFMRPKMSGTSGSSRGRPAVFTRKPGLGRNPDTRKLQSQFQKLSLGVDFLLSGNEGESGGNRNQRPGTVSVHYRRSTSNSRSMKATASKSSLSLFRAPKKESFVQQRVDSAKKIQIKDLMSKLRVLENAIDDLTVENRTLRTVHHRQDVALRRYEGAESDFPKLLEKHSNEVTSLQQGLRKAQSYARNYEERIRGLTFKVFNLERENRKLQAIVRHNELDERQKLEKQVLALEDQIKDVEKKGNEYRRRYEILDKNQRNQIGGIRGKLRGSNSALFNAEREIDRLTELLRQKDRVINYLRIRSSRNPELEPPIVRKMSEVVISSYKPVHKLLIQQQQQAGVDYDEPHNPTYHPHYPAHREHLPKMQFSLRGQEKPEAVKKVRQIRIEEEDDSAYSIPGSVVTSDMLSVSSYCSRTPQDTVRTSDMNMSRGSLSPCYSRSEDTTLERHDRSVSPIRFVGQHPMDHTFTEDEMTMESDGFEELSGRSSPLNPGYKGRMKSRTYSPMDINTIRGCNSEPQVKKKEAQEAGTTRTAKLEPVRALVPVLEQEESPKKRKVRMEIEANDVPHEGKKIETIERKKPDPAPITPNDGGGDASAPEPEPAFFAQSSYPSTAVEIPQATSSESSCDEEDNQQEPPKPTQDQTPQKEMVVPSRKKVVEDTDDDDDKDRVMSRIFEALLQRSDKVEKEANKIICPTFRSFGAESVGAGGDGSPKNGSPKKSAKTPSPRPVMSRPFALSSSFYVVGSKPSLRGNEDQKAEVAGPSNPVPNGKAEEVSKPSKIATLNQFEMLTKIIEDDPVEPPVEKPRPTCLRPSIVIDLEDDYEPSSFSESDHRRFEESLLGIKKQGGKKDSWSLASLLKPDAGKSGLGLKASSKSSSSVPNQASKPLNGILKNTKGPQTGNVASTKNNPKPGSNRRFRSSWE